MAHRMEIDMHPKYTTDDIARFWSKVHKTDTCWLWTGTRDGWDYGSIKIQYKQLGAHRVAYELTYGDIPPGLFCCHACDVRECVNPAHIRLATHEENQREKAERGRAGGPWLRRFQNPPYTAKKHTDIADRFWAKAQKTESCWLWTARRDADGYGKFEPTPRKIVFAHRFAYELSYGEIPPDMFVCHTCDQPACINPDHLFLGTPADNTRDRDGKGRQAKGNQNGAYTHPKQRPHGEKHGNAKLTEQQVREIRARHAAGESKTQLAADYGVSRALIRYVVLRLYWTHV